MTIAGYQDNGNSGVLDLLLQPVGRGPSSQFLLTLDGHYDASDFVTLFNGSETVLLDRPSPSPVGGSGGAGLWANANGGDWGTASNWGNDALPGSFDPVDLTNDIGGNASYTATYDGGIDGIPGVGATTVESLEVDQGVTFDIFNQGALFLSGDFQNNGTVIADRGEIAGSGGGSNTGTITLSGDDSATGGLFINGTFANMGHVVLNAGGSAQFGAVTGNGLLTIAGGALEIDPLGHASSSDTVDSNDIAFGQPDSTLLLGGLGQVTGNISGFAASDAIFFTGEQMTIAGYDATTGVLDLHAANGGGDVFLTFTGSYDASDFIALYDGSETVLLDRPSPSPVGGSGGAGLWANANGGDWGTASNWGNDALPGSFDPVDLTNDIGGNASYTATYDGGIDGIPGVGATTVESLEVDQGVTFDIFNQGALFLSGDFQNNGTVIADRGEIAGSGGGSNTGTITLSGDDSATGGLFINGTFANMGHVVLNAGGSAQFGAVTGNGLLTIAGGALEIDPLGQSASSAIADTNDISFDASDSNLLLGGEGQIAGTISGFGVSDSIGFLDEQATITSYVDDGGHGVLTLHLHSLDGGADSDLTLNLDGTYTRADFIVVHGGQNTFLLEKPPGLVQASLNGVWSNASGGDWGTASNWHNNVVPGASDDILLSTPVGHTVTFNGAIDGIPGYGIGGANSLTVGNGVTFQVTNHGQLFFDDTLTNGGSVDVVELGPKLRRQRSQYQPHHRRRHNGRHQLDLRHGQRHVRQQRHGGYQSPRLGDLRFGDRQRGTQSRRRRDRAGRCRFHLGSNRRHQRNRFHGTGRHAHAVRPRPNLRTHFRLRRQ